MKNVRPSREDPSTSELDSASDGDRFRSLADLLRLCNHAAALYQQAAEIPAVSSYRQVFLINARQRVCFAAEIRSEIKRAGGIPTPIESTPEGEPWTRDANGLAVFTTLQELEGAAERAYTIALADPLLPRAERTLRRQLSEVAEKHGHVGRLRAVFEYGARHRSAGDVR